MRAPAASDMDSLALTWRQILHVTSAWQRMNNTCEWSTRL